MRDFPISSVIDRAREIQGLRSDYMLHKVAGFSQQGIANWRKGRALPDEKSCAKLAELAHMDPDVLIARVNAARANDDACRAIWERIADRLERSIRGAAAAIFAVVLATLFVAPNEASASAAGDAGSPAAIELSAHRMKWIAGEPRGYRPSCHRGLRGMFIGHPCSSSPCTISGTGHGPGRSEMTPTQVAAVMHQPIWSVGPDDTLESIGREFVARRLRWAPVLDGSDGLMAVVSAWDLLRFQVDGHPPQTPAWQACTYRPECASPDMALTEAARMMRDQGIHHLPVVSAGKVVGVVSSLDLLAGL